MERASWRVERWAEKPALLWNGSDVLVVDLKSTRNLTNLTLFYFVLLPPLSFTFLKYKQIKCVSEMSLSLSDSCMGAAVGAPRAGLRGLGMSCKAANCTHFKYSYHKAGNLSQTFKNKKINCICNGGRLCAVKSTSKYLLKCSPSAVSLTPLFIRSMILILPHLELQIHLSAQGVCMGTKWSRVLLLLEWWCTHEGFSAFSDSCSR